MPAVVTTDDQRIKQVLLNLLQNALKFTMRGGITVRVRLEKGCYLVISVEDTGIGISDQE